MSYLAVNTSNKVGTVFFGADAQTVGPHEKLPLQSKPSFWTSNIQLVKSITRSRASSMSSSSAEASEVGNG
jgi:hypothetical protein